MTLETLLKSEAEAIGFDVCRICRVDEPWLAGAGLEAFVEAGHHGTMDWMAQTLERRRHPQAMWAEARSAVVLGLNYGPDHDPMAKLAQRGTGNISVYAQGKDYHDVVKTKLRQMARRFAEVSGEDVKIFVDTAPLMEKPLAQKAGIGWQGKHTNVVSRDLGSWLFLGVILTSAALAPDAAETDHCGRCTQCLDVCPTKAFVGPYKLDARRCISYLTIEHKGVIPVEFRADMGNRIYGCDDCLAVCPWNKFASTASEAAFWARAELKAPGLDELLALDEAGFREVFSGSPIKRIGHARFIRNVLIAAGNSGDAGRVDERFLVYLNADDTGVRAAAIWALGRLDPARFEREKAVRLDRESDEEVRAEWHRGAAGTI